MNKTIAVALLLSTTALLDINAQGFFEGNGGPIDPLVVLLNLYTNFPHFSAKAAVTLQEEGATKKLPLMAVRYAAADGKITSISDITQLTPECADLFKQLGIAETQSIFSIHTNEAVVVYPGKKGYYRLALPAYAPRLSPKQTQKTAVTREEVGGHDCEHYRFAVTAADGTKLSVDAGEAKDLNGFPVKLAYSTEYFAVARYQKATVSVRFDEVSFAKPDSSAFVPPDDFKQYPDRAALMAAPVPKD